MFIAQEKRSVCCMLGHQQKPSSRGNYPLHISNHKKDLFSLCIHFDRKILRIFYKNLSFGAVMQPYWVFMGPQIQKPFYQVKLQLVNVREGRDLHQFKHQTSFLFNLFLLCRFSFVLGIHPRFEGPQGCGRGPAGHGLFQDAPQ